MGNSSYGRGPSWNEARDGAGGPVLIVGYLLVVVAVGFAISIGAHYTGACMGMPYAAGAIRPGRALLLMAPLAFLGAVLASSRVEATVGHSILETPTVAIGLALAIVGAAFVLTSAYNLLTVPTSTIQILVFSAVGAGLAAGLAIDWSTIATLLVLWAIAPFAAFALGAAFVWTADRVRPPGPTSQRLGAAAVAGLVGVGAAASFAMGANDVSNASGSLVMSGEFTLFLAAVVGGIGLAVGVLTWGRPLLERVAFDLVRLDARTATSAQLAQSVVILAAVGFGLFTSMNQALVGAMIGVGVARRQSTVVWKAIRGIVIGWSLGPVSGLAIGYAFALVLLRVGRA
ncbi:MAG: inorganic phosphate transporter family protein [Thermoplasmata archaeon]|nr:inorganic phosphate transporter family protein [Thermoplasmata archaeon]